MEFSLVNIDLFSSLLFIWQSLLLRLLLMWALNHGLKREKSLALLFLSRFLLKRPPLHFLLLYLPIPSETV